MFLLQLTLNVELKHQEEIPASEGGIWARSLPQASARWEPDALTSVSVKHSSDAPAEPGMCLQAVRRAEVIGGVGIGRNAFGY